MSLDDEREKCLGIRLVREERGDCQVINIYWWVEGDKSKKQVDRKENSTSF